MEYFLSFVALGVLVDIIAFTSAVDGQQIQNGEWRTTDWSPCSRSCGPSGKRHREVFCYRNERRVQNSLCFGQRPTTVEGCKALDCPPERYEFIECNKTCKSGSAAIWGCRFIDRVGALVNVNLSKCHIVDKFRSCTAARSANCPVFHYVPQQWSQCSVTCGAGVQARDVVCIKENETSKKVDYDNCGHLKEPIKKRSCRMKICSQNYTYEFDTGDWSRCSTYCGLGTLHRRVGCVQRWPNGTKRLVDRHICERNLKEEIEETVVCQAASASSCKWTLAPVEAEPCGKGEASFHLSSRCKNTKTNRVVDDLFCKEVLGKKPTLMSRQPCLYRWNATEWTQCSASCGRGMQHRHVTCNSHFHNATHRQERKVADSTCKHIPTPPNVRDCNTNACENISSGQGSTKQNLGSRWRSQKLMFLFVVVLSIEVLLTGW